jgi:hypothetical protein
MNGEMKDLEDKRKEFIDSYKREFLTQYHTKRTCPEYVHIDDSTILGFMLTELATIKYDINHLRQNGR